MLQIWTDSTTVLFGAQYSVPDLYAAAHGERVRLFFRPVDIPAHKDPAGQTMISVREPSTHDQSSQPGDESSTSRMPSITFQDRLEIELPNPGKAHELTIHLGHRNCQSWVLLQHRQLGARPSKRKLSLTRSRS